MNSRTVLGRAALLALVWAPFAGPRAETLEQALAIAYRSSPMLHGQQAAQRAVDETAVQARAGWRPTVTITANAAYQRVPFDSFNYAAGSVETNDAAASLTVNQPLYTGGRVTNAVRAADARVRAGQQGLRATEAQMFQAVVLAYMDVLRDQDVLAVRQADFSTLERQVRDTAARYQLGGPITRTDVAQAEAQREGAGVALADARAQLAVEPCQLPRGCRNASRARWSSLPACRACHADAGRGSGPARKLSIPAWRKPHSTSRRPPQTSPPPALPGIRRLGCRARLAPSALPRRSAATSTTGK